MFKRIFDLTICLLLLFLIAPLIIVISLLIIAFDEWPVFFVQERVGLHEKTFKIYKFRTMRLNNDNNGEVFKGNNDVSTIGHYLRRLKLDELPQLLNVISGDMSMVGPRPLTIESQFETKSRIRLNVKPGITGLAQVNGNIYLSRQERVILDQEYVANNNFLMDLSILFKTILVIAVGEKHFKK